MNIFANQKADAGQMILIQLAGLRKKLSFTKTGPRNFRITLRVPPTLLVKNLGKMVLQTEEGTYLAFSVFLWRIPPGEWTLTYVHELGTIDDFKSFKFADRKGVINSTWEDIFTTPVEVTSGRSCYNEDQGYKIHLDQTIAAFYSKAFPDPIQVKLRAHRASSGSEDQPSYSIMVNHGNQAEAQISPMRTLRVPEDDMEYAMPNSLGTFPLYDVKSFSGELPTPMVAQGGIFVGMHGMYTCKEQFLPHVWRHKLIQPLGKELEAVRLVFDSIPGKRFAVRPFFGGINGISGLSVFQDLAREDVTNTTGSSEKVSQDYVVLPNQQHLDGVAIKPGTVKQLVVAPTVTHRSSRLSSKLKWPGEKSKSTEALQDKTRDGSTIEWQMTGKDTLGGLQLQIIPEFDVKKIHAGATEHLIVNSNISSLSWAPEHGEGFFYPQPPKHHKHHTPVSIPGYDILKTPRELGLHEGQYTVCQKNN